MQAAHQTFDAVSALGTSFTQTRLAMQPGKRVPFRGLSVENVYFSMLDVDMTGTFHWPRSPPSSSPPTWTRCFWCTGSRT
jgi:hypothetical protein